MHSSKASVFFACPKINERDLEFLSTPGYGWRRSSSDEACLNTHRVGERQSLPIVRVEYLHFGNYRFSSTLGDSRRDEADPTVRESPIHVHEEEFDLTSTREHFWRSEGFDGIV